MEILAIINSLEYVKKNLDKFKAKSFTEIEILSDSETAIKCYKLADTWRSHDWLGVYENPIKNVDLLKRIITLKNSVKFNCRPYWVLNKSSEITQQVDKLAKAASKRIILKDDIGYIEPRICKTEVKGKTENDLMKLSFKKVEF